MLIELVQTLFALITRVLFPSQPRFRGLSLGTDDLPDEGATMGTLIVGKQGSGKTTWLAKQIVDAFKRYPDQAVFVLDWSGNITDAILQLLLADSDSERLLKRVVYDDMGNPEWTVPLPEFSEAYDPELALTARWEQQTSRVTQNLVKLHTELVKGAPLLGGSAVQDIFPNVGRLLNAIVSNEHHDSWQITEAKRLFKDDELRKACTRFGGRVPHAKYYFEQEFLPAEEREKELRTYALRNILTVIEPREIRARLGYYEPGWTPREAIHKGLMVICDGARLINREGAQHYLFTQVYSLIMAEINKRRPGDPNDQPVSLVMDEVYSLIRIPGMAPEISTLSPQYRSRKLQLYVVLQELAQMSDELRPHIWSLGNAMCFALSNFEEAYEVGQQLFTYDPRAVKVEPQRTSQHPIMEPDRGQYLEIANWIQRLNHREAIARRYFSEQEMDRRIRHIPRTRDVVANVSDAEIQDVKEQLLKQHGVQVRHAIDVVNTRTLPDPASNQSSPPSRTTL